MRPHTAQTPSREGNLPLASLPRRTSGGLLSSLYRVIAQLPGGALRLPLSGVREAAARPGPFQDAVNTYTSAFIVETSRSAVGNAPHGIVQRLAKWILQT